MKIQMQGPVEAAMASQSCNNLQAQFRTQEQAMCKPKPWWCGLRSRELRECVVWGKQIVIVQEQEVPRDVTTAVSLTDRSKVQNSERNWHSGTQNKDIVDQSRNLNKACAILAGNISTLVVHICSAPAQSQVEVTNSLSQRDIRPLNSHEESSPHTTVTRLLSTATVSPV